MSVSSSRLSSLCVCDRLTACSRHVESEDGSTNIPQILTKSLSKRHNELFKVCISVGFVAARSGHREARCVYISCYNLSGLLLVSHL